MTPSITSICPLRPTGNKVKDVTVENNYYTRLGLPLGAPVEVVEEAFEELDAEARTAGDTALSEQLAEAHRGLTQPGIRSYHNQQIKWAAAGDWYADKFPTGRSVEEHRLWADYRRQVIEAEPTLWERIKDVFDGD